MPSDTIEVGKVWRESASDRGCCIALELRNVQARTRSEVRVRLEETARRGVEDGNMAPSQEKLLNASDLARLCEVDLKTIHNWVERGRITHFRTPGRHLRFRPADVAEFLRMWGYVVPRELSGGATLEVLIVGKPDTLALAQRACGDSATLRGVEHPYDALVAIGAAPSDVVLIDTPRALGSVDLGALLEALHRALPRAELFVLADGPRVVPAFVRRIARDAATLRAALFPARGEVPAEVGERRGSASGSSR